MMKLRSPEGMVWRTAPYEWADAERLTRELDVPFVVATILASRGFADPAMARDFLASPNRVPNPFLFEHMQAAVDQIAAAVEQKRRVVVHGDYDADGITATAVMVLGLRELGLEAEPYLPNRFSQGFGLSQTAVESIAAAGDALLITVDCGVNYPQEVALARELGLDVIVVDHHEPGPVLPDCHLIHPVAGEYPTHDLCGVGLAFKVLHAVSCHLRQAPLEQVPKELNKYLDLVAIGTIGDLAPLLGENRYYVKEGLKLVSIGSRVGIRALSKVACCPSVVDSTAVSFRIAPRLNAAGRLGTPDLSLELLLTEDEDRATSLSQRLHDLNGERQDVERAILEDALSQAEQLEQLPRVLVLTGRDWHEGVVGIVASRLVERFHRPAILLSIRDGIAKGSGRSVSAYDLVGALTSCAEHLTVYGGHRMAVGLTMDEDGVAAFREAIEKHAAGVLTEEDLLPVCRVDAILRGEEVNADVAVALSSLGPFGSGNPRPRLAVLGAGIIQPECTRTGAHLKCQVEVGGVRTRAIGFGMGDRVDELRQNPQRSIMGVQLRLNEWQGNVRAEFSLDSIGPPIQTAEGLVECGPLCSLAGLVGEHTAPGIEPAARKVSAHLLKPLDHRGGGDPLVTVARVLATKQSVVLLTCSISHAASELQARLPFAEMVNGTAECVSSACAVSAAGRVDGCGVVIAEWDSVVSQPAIAASRAHCIAIDPPYREEHSELLSDLSSQGVQVHLCYGEAERDKTARLLRYLVHPRFAMVCVYRALRGGATGAKVHPAAAELAWTEAGVILNKEALSRAADILKQLGLDRPSAGEDKMEVRSVPLYTSAEAEYEECHRLCRIL